MGRRSKHHSSVRVLEDLPSPEQHARKANTRDEEREREREPSFLWTRIGRFTMFRFLLLYFIGREMFRAEVGRR